MSIDAQVARMKSTWPLFTAHNIDRAQQSARWTGHVEPHLTRYKLEIRYAVGNFPEVRVLTPPLTRLPGNADGALPHVYAHNRFARIRPGVIQIAPSRDASREAAP
jgi:hypothetical protein